MDTQATRPQPVSPAAVAALDGGAPTSPAQTGPLSRGQMIGIAIGVVVFLALICAFLVWLSNIGALPMLRDLLIIFLAFESILIFVLLAWLIIQVMSVVEYINTEVKPILGSVQESVTTVKTTTQFLQDSVVSPVIKVQSTTTGIVQGLRALVGRGGSRRV